MPRSPLLLAGAGAALLAPCFLSPGAGQLRGTPTKTQAAAGQRTETASRSGVAAVTAAVPVAGLLAAAGRRASRHQRHAAAAEVEAEPVFDPSKEPGVTLPMRYFDPLGFAKQGDREGFYQLRAAELKHGRVAMIAAVGCVIQHNVKYPGFEDVPTGIQAAITPPGTYGMLAIFALAGALELTIFKQDPDMDPGDFGDPAGFGQYYTEWKDRELNNCRMGMMSFLGIVVAELVTGKDGVEQIWTPLGNLSAE